jgi:hypothetical protein
MTRSFQGSIRSRLALVSSLTALPLFLPFSASAAEVTPGQHTLRGASVQICNIIGETTLVPGSGSDVIVEVTPRGADGDKLRVVLDECRGQKRLRVVYPSDHIVDPSMGRSEVRMSSLHGCCGPGTIRFTRPGDGIDARADLTIHVPKDQKLGLSQAAGRMEVTGVRGALAFDTSSGDIELKDVVGSVSIDTGSGEISMKGTKGSTSIDTGSGTIRIEDFDGTLAVDSGSGAVSVLNLRTDKTAISSGSGDVTGENVVAGVLAVDSGSGGIAFSGLTSPEIVFDTGSGGVSADLERSPRSLRIDSGSGGVTLTAPRDLDARLEISCSKRRLDIGLPVVASHVGDEYFAGRAGSGRGLIVIESGSGSVSLRAGAK